ncbi:uncharacterized protein LOC127102454 [Lathyrus oleraceus]|uniref:uncharacterized protein LOC127102454 n=1 Tax=Pisum sativum TaxID=3888 RepID=UPI0021CF6EB3|nr:uncharacterized protein LOC127102454 [Pisum sativum]
MAKINCKSGFPINQDEDDSEEYCELPAELTRLLEQEEKEIQPYKEPVDVINLGSKTDKREVKVGASLAKHLNSELVELYHEYVDIFTWSYQDMSGLDTSIVEHHLPLKPECPPVKQKLRRTRPNMELKIKEEVKKQLDAGFLAIFEYPQWVANIVPVLKKDEIEVYVDEMFAKSRIEEDHLVNLRKLFVRLRKFKLRLNPAKCTFGVRSGKLLGFIVSQKGIEVDPDKVRAIQEMPAPQTEKEV